jgi:hypothetical protein
MTGASAAYDFEAGEAHMPVAWSELEPLVRAAFERTGRVERADVVALAYEQNASDDVVDAMDMIGSRVFNSIDDAHQFLVSQHATAD